MGSDYFNSVGFGGQFGYYHDLTGRYLLGHRYYNPSTGRFVTRDPLGYAGGINLYGFCDVAGSSSRRFGYNSAMTLTQAQKERLMRQALAGAEQGMADGKPQ